jgi:hypothetical protein
MKCGKTNLEPHAIQHWQRRSDPNLNLGWILLVIIGSSKSREKWSRLEAALCMHSRVSQECTNPSVNHQENRSNNHKPYEHDSCPQVLEETIRYRSLLWGVHGQRLRPAQSTSLARRGSSTCPNHPQYKWINSVHPRGATCEQGCFGLVFQSGRGWKIQWPLDHPYGRYQGKGNGSLVVNKRSWSVVESVGMENKPSCIGGRG